MNFWQLSGCGKLGWANGWPWGPKVFSKGQENPATFSAKKANIIRQCNIDIVGNLILSNIGNTEWWTFWWTYPFPGFRDTLWQTRMLVQDVHMFLPIHQTQEMLHKEVRKQRHLHNCKIWNNRRKITSWKDFNCSLHQLPFLISVIIIFN